MRRLALAAALVALAVPALAQGDPRPTGSRTTCDHAGIESATHHRRVDYLHQQYGLSCTHAQHVAKLWVHSCTSPFSGCNVHDGAIYWWCTAKSTTAGYLASCQSGGNTILIGWVRF